MKEILEALKKYLALSSYAMKIVADAIISTSSRSSISTTESLHLLPDALIEDLDVPGLCWTLEVGTYSYPGAAHSLLSRQWK